MSPKQIKILKTQMRSMEMQDPKQSQNCIVPNVIN